MSYSHDAYATPCTSCGKSAVTWVSWGADCRGNDAGYSISCGNCKRTYLAEDWTQIASLEVRKRRRQYWKSQFESFGPSKHNPYHPTYNFRRLLPL